MRSHKCSFIALSLISAVSFLTPLGNCQGFRALTIDAAKDGGRIRSFQGLNGPPTPVIAGLPRLVEQYKELHVDQVRTHDFMGPTEVDSQFAYHSPELSWLIPDPMQRAAVVRAGNAGTIFPDWNADPEKPESYRFGPTDKVIAAIQQTGAEVYYRVGRSWGANTEPPADYDKFADIVKHIAMHYNQGWANGFHYRIRYWEFWNEPEGFWSGTPEQFYALYQKTAKALKSVDPDFRVGGDAMAAPHDSGPWREGFLDYCAAHEVPVDFFSWHLYSNASSDPYDVMRMGEEIRHVLDTHGFPKAESILSEWNLTPDFSVLEAAELQGAHTAAFVGAVLSYLEDAPIDHAHFYRGDAAWMGLFDLNGGFFKPAFVFKAMGQMLDTPKRLLVSGTDTFGFTALAGKSEDGNTIQILISNYAIPADYKPRTMSIPEEFRDPIYPPLWERQPHTQLPGRTDIEYRNNNGGYSLSLVNFPRGSAGFTLRRYRINSNQSLELVEDRLESGTSLMLSRAMPVDTVELIVLARK